MTRIGIVCLGLFSAILVETAIVRADEKPGAAAESKTELDLLRRERDTLEARIRVMQDQLDEARAALVLAKIQTDSIENRCKKLQDELILLKAEKVVIAPIIAPKPRVESLPPPRVKSGIGQGKISAIGADGRLMQISIGSDDGLKIGQSLDVFRPGNGTERPLYLGTMTLTRVDPQASLGQYKSVPSLDRRPKIGDEVTSELFVK